MDDGETKKTESLIPWVVIRFYYFTTQSFSSLIFCTPLSSSHFLKPFSSSGVNFTISPSFSIKVKSLRIYIYLKTSEARSEEHTSELQSRENIVCRLLLE